jgi:uncharacterized protein (TIGR03067 family)
MERATMHLRRTGGLLLSLVAALLGARTLDDRDAVKNERKQHQGTWTVTSSIYEGQKADAEVMRSITRTVSGDHVVWKRNGKQFAGTKFELDPRQEPKTIDVIPVGGPNRDKRVLGIYKLEGDQLTICMAAAGGRRPKEFKAPKGSGCTLRTFRRQLPRLTR